MAMPEWPQDAIGYDALTAVTAHGLLNSMAVVTGALKTLVQRGHAIDDERRDALVADGLAQAHLVSATLRDLVLGLPQGASVLLEQLDADSADRRLSSAT